MMAQEVGERAWTSARNWWLAVMDAVGERLRQSERWQAFKQSAAKVPHTTAQDSTLIYARSDHNSLAPPHYVLLSLLGMQPAPASSRWLGLACLCSDAWSREAAWTAIMRSARVWSLEIGLTAPCVVCAVQVAPQIVTFGVLLLVNPTYALIHAGTMLLMHFGIVEFARRPPPYSGR